MPPIPLDPPPPVAAVFARWPEPARGTLLAVRLLLFETAQRSAAVGPLTETLKWGEPAYLTAASGSGSTVRLAWKPALPERAAVLFNCRTTLVEAFRTRFSDRLRFEGNRAVLLAAGDPLPEVELAVCLGLALTYHLDRRRTASARP